jgi:ATP-dependent RNA helicase DeaD
VKKTIADALAAKGYDKLTPVQEAVSDPALTGADMLVSAQTGSGKTVGFGLAIAPTLLGAGDSFERASTPLALIIAPTRELAMQVKRELAWLYGPAGAVMASCVGGMDMRDERRALDRGAHIVVATPGRLRDHIMRGSIDLSQSRAVVLDEADEMLDLGFREDLEFILGEAPDERQTLLFSATVPKAIANLAKSYQKDAVRVSTKAETSQHADIEYHAMAVSPRDGENAIINVLRYYEAPNAIVFCNTRAMVNRITTRLSNRGFSVVALSGELSQNERTHALQAMRDGRARVCVATDVAARGIDLPNLDLVVHAELPGSHETMLHRSGRTGRAGRKGVSALIVTPKVRKKAERILSMAKVQAVWDQAPSAETVNARDDERMMADPAWSEAVTEGEMDAIKGLTVKFTSEQLAAAYLRLYKANRSAPEELSSADAAPKPREEFGASTWFSVAGGRKDGAEPRRLLPMLCKAGGLDKDDIGAIRIQQDESYIQIRDQSVERFLAEIGSDMTVEGAKLTKLTRAPNLGASGPRGGGAPRGGKPGYKGSKPKGDWHPAGPTSQGKGTARGDGAPRKPRTKASRGDEQAAASYRAPRENLTETHEGAVKPRSSKGAGKPSGKPYGKSGAKGPPPPKGKSNSKKNQARNAAAKAEGGKRKPRTKANAPKR